MSSSQSYIGVPRAVMEIFGIAFLRFRPLQKAWVTWLVGVNSAGLLFIGHVEAQVALAAVGLAVLLQALIYQRLRFVRLLGTAHVLWLPMLAWMAMRLAAAPADERAFHVWLLVLIGTNSLSLVIDAWDATRFLRGERSPHYAW